MNETKTAATGAELIAAERARQVSGERWLPEHDDTHHRDGELAKAAACYALPPRLLARQGVFPAFWPWEHKDWKPTPDDRIRELTKAGALIAAEIDRLLRASESPMTSPAGRSQQGAPSEQKHHGPLVLVGWKSSVAWDHVVTPEGADLFPDERFDKLTVVDPREHRLQVLAEVEKALRTRGEDAIRSMSEAEDYGPAQAADFVASLAATEERNEDG